MFEGIVWLQVLNTWRRMKSGITTMMRRYHCEKHLENQRVVDCLSLEVGSIPIQIEESGDSTAKGGPELDPAILTW
jgi:hypothetical protein